MVKKEDAGGFYFLFFIFIFIFFCFILKRKKKKLVDPAELLKYEQHL